MKELAVIPQIALEAQEAGRRHQRVFKPMPYAELLRQPEFADDWWYIPAEEDRSVIPIHATRALQVMEWENFDLAQVIIGHEVPRLLPPPPGEWPAEKRARLWAERKQKLKEAAQLTGEVTVAAAKVAVGVAGIAAAATGIALAVMLAAAVQVDPALIVVVRDPRNGELGWVKLCEWYE